MFVQVPRGDTVRRAEDRDPVLVQVAPHAVAGEAPRPFEALVVLGVRIGDIDLSAHRVDNVIKDSADTGENALRPCDRRGWMRHGVDDEDVLVEGEF